MTWEVVSKIAVVATLASVGLGVWRQMPPWRPLWLKNGRVPIRFLRGVPPYNAGETDQFRAYVKAKTAMYVRTQDRLRAWLHDLRQLGS